MIQVLKEEIDYYEKDSLLKSHRQVRYGAVSGGLPTYRQYRGGRRRSGAERSMHDMDFPESLLAVGRAGAGVNNIPLDACAEDGIVVFNTPGANANGVKELVIAGMLMASRDIVGGIEWCKANAEDDNITKDTEKSKKAFAGCEIKGKKLGVVGLGAIGARLPMQPPIWGWRSMDSTPIFLLTPHGDCPEM